MGWGKNGKGAKADALALLLGWDFGWGNPAGLKGGKGQRPGHQAADWRAEAPVADADHLCGACGEYGHFRRDCRHCDAVCTICGGRGHIAKACKKQSAKGGGKQQQKGKGGKAQALGADGKGAKGAGGKGGKEGGGAAVANAGKGRAQQENAPLWADVAKEKWVCTGCLAEHTSMGLKTCPACHKPRRQCDDAKPKIFLTPEEQKAIDLCHKEAGVDNDVGMGAGDSGIDGEHFIGEAGGEDGEWDSGSDGDAQPMETAGDRKRRRHLAKLRRMAQNCRDIGDEEGAAKYDKMAKECPKPAAHRPMTTIVELNKSLLRKEEIKATELERIRKKKKEAEEAMNRIKKDRLKRIKEEEERHAAALKTLGDMFDDAEKRTAVELEEADKDKQKVIEQHEKTANQLQQAMAKARQKGAEGSGAEPVQYQPAVDHEIVVTAASFNPDTLRQQYLQAGATPAIVEQLLAIQLAHLNSISVRRPLNVSDPGAQQQQQPQVGATVGQVDSQEQRALHTMFQRQRVEQVAVQQAAVGQANQEAMGRELEYRTQLAAGTITQAQFDQLMVQLGTAHVPARVQELVVQATQLGAGPAAGALAT